MTTDTKEYLLIACQLHSDYNDMGSKAVAQLEVTPELLETLTYRHALFDNPLFSEFDPPSQLAWESDDLRIFETGHGVDNEALREMEAPLKLWQVAWDEGVILTNTSLGWQSNMRTDSMVMRVWKTSGVNWTFERSTSYQRYVTEYLRREHFDLEPINPSDIV